MKSGKYSFVGMAPIGPIEGTMDVVVDDTLVTGSVDLLGATAEIQDGKVENEVFTGFCAPETPWGVMEFNFNVSFDGDSLSGSVVNPLLTVDVTGQAL